MQNHLSTNLLWVAVLGAFSTQMQAQICSGGGAPATATLTLTGRNSVDGFNDNDNARGTLTVAFAGEVVGVQFTGVNLTTTGGSYCNEALIEFADVRNSVSNYVDINASGQNSASPCTDLPATGFFDLADLGYQFPTNGTSVYWELWEGFDDVTNGADATYTAGTATIFVCPVGQVLPLELKSFSGKTLASTNLLEWATAEEKDVADLLVERSWDATNWTTIGRAASKGSHSTYQLEDAAPLAKAYYRLRVLDIDGSEHFSNVVLLNRRDLSFGITSAFPSPTTDLVTLQYSVADEEQITVRVSDLTGRTVLEQIVEAQKGNNTVTLSLGALPASTYTVTFGTANKVADPVRVVKQ